MIVPVTRICHCSFPRPSLKATEGTVTAKLAEKRFTWPVVLPMTVLALSVLAVAAATLDRSELRLLAAVIALAYININVVAGIAAAITRSMRKQIMLRRTLRFVTIAVAVWLLWVDYTFGDY